MRKIELLSPAGSLDKLSISYRYGADAVYLGGKAFNLRARSSNFSNAQLKEAVAVARSFGKKIYVTLNILAHDREIKALPSFIKYLDEIKVDAVIVADLGILDLVQENSTLPIHISTQASATNWRSVKMYQRLGAKRVVLARETSLSEVRKIKDQVPEIELELFIHGAMCMTYSGRCNLSSYFAERDGNRGQCANTCRWKYHVVEEKRPGEYFPVYEDETGTYMYNSKDLCTVDFLDKVLDAGVDGLKIEGRMKSHFYCANVTRVYRQALDSYLSGSWQYRPEWKAELEKMSHRGYTSGFYLGKLDSNSEQRSGAVLGSRKFAAIVREKVDAQTVVVETREAFSLDSDLEVLQPGKETQSLRIFGMKNLKTEDISGTAKPNYLYSLSCDRELDVYDIVTVSNDPLSTSSQVESAPSP